LVQISRKQAIEQRVVQLRKTVKVNTQRIRRDLLNYLEEIFNLAASLARGRYQTQVEGGKQKKVTLKERRMWARVAGYVAQVMNSVAEGFDEREIDVQLDELERLVREAKAKAKTGKTKKRIKPAGKGEGSS